MIYMYTKYDLIYYNKSESKMHSLRAIEIFFINLERLSGTLEDTKCVRNYKSLANLSGMSVLQNISNSL